MRWLEMTRNPEPDVMEALDDVCAYASAAGQRHLSALDDTFVDHVLSLAPRGSEPAGLLLDVGCGPGNIVLKIARRCPKLLVVGLDRSRHMVETARRASAELKLEARASFQQANAGHLPFAGGAFDFVLSNSVLHHLSDPATVLREMLRVTKLHGAILLRDLRRPSRLSYPWHVRWYGRHYSGIMKRLFEDSVRAAYTPEELIDLLGSSGIAEAQIFFHERSHMGFVYGGHDS